MDYIYAVARGQKDRPLALYRCEHVAYHTGAGSHHMDRYIHGEWMHQRTDDIIAFAKTDTGSQMTLEHFKRGVKAGKLQLLGPTFGPSDATAACRPLHRRIVVGTVDITVISVQWIDLEAISYVIDTSVMYMVQDGVSIAMATSTRLFAGSTAIDRALDDAVNGAVRLAGPGTKVLKAGDANEQWDRWDEAVAAGKRERDKQLAEAAAKLASLPSSKLDSSAFAERMRLKREVGR